ncbi:hypothetical protein D3C81_1598570 [compost metagenome]
MRLCGLQMIIHSNEPILKANISILKTNILHIGLPSDREKQLVSLKLNSLISLLGRDRNTVSFLDRLRNDCGSR